MIIILGFVVCIVIGAVLIWRKGSWWGNYEDSGMRGVLTTIGLAGLAICLIFPLPISYGSNLGLRAYQQAVIGEYADVVTYYGDVIEVDTGMITDFRYKEMGEFVRDLRNKTVRYNRTLILKREMKRNPLFSWLIVGPDPGMKFIRFRNVAE